MSKQIHVFVGCALIMLLAVVVFVYQLYTRAMSGELGDKKYYSILQGLELEHRNDVDRTFVMIINNVNQAGVDVVGFPAEANQAARVWVILNRIGENGALFAVPERLKTKILCRDVDVVSSKKQGDNKVLERLYFSCLK
ncbi:hypothetical protein NUH87_05670 [Pseudomonas batumici]|uniref:hypothetical protein n=1 Tax=Pseudomonas batumici TaxID=226910 RepID=UPI0030D1029C